MLGYIYTERKRTFPTIFVGTECEKRVEFPNNPVKNEADFVFAFAQCK